MTNFSLWQVPVVVVVVSDSIQKCIAMSSQDHMNCSSNRSVMNGTKTNGGTTVSWALKLTESPQCTSEHKRGLREEEKMGEMTGVSTQKRRARAQIFFLIMVVLWRSRAKGKNKEFFTQWLICFPVLVVFRIIIGFFACCGVVSLKWCVIN